MNLNGKRIILTGASSGIGLELLPILHEKGAKVLAVGRKPYTSPFPSIHYIQADIATQEGVDFVFEQANLLIGGVDIFIANAGFAYYESVQKADWNRARSIFDTNVFSPIYAFHTLKAMKQDQPFQFVATASAISYLPLPGYALYSGTKHALRSFFQAAHNELPADQIITLIHPIATKTAFFKKDTPVPFPAQTAKTVAKYYIKGIEKNTLHIFPSKIFWFIHSIGWIHRLVQRREKNNFNTWRETHE